MFDSIELNYQERFLILYTLHNLPSHDMRTARLYKDLKEVCSFDTVISLNEDDGVGPVYLSLGAYPDFVPVMLAAITFLFSKTGFPPPIAALALELVDRLSELGGVSLPETPQRPPKENTEESGLAPHIPLPPGIVAPPENSPGGEDG